MQTETDTAMIVRIPRELDRALNAVAPEFLRGTNKATIRVQWAIEEFLKDRGADTHDKKDADHG